MQKYEPGTPGYRSAVVTGTIVRVLINVIQISLMVWAAFETSGFLRWALLGYVIFTLFVTMAAMSAQAVQKEVTR